jgi:hypothetical protein
LAREPSLKKRTQAAGKLSFGASVAECLPTLFRAVLRYERIRAQRRIGDRRWEQPQVGLVRDCVLDASIFGFERSKPEDSGVAEGHDPDLNLEGA